MSKVPVPPPEDAVPLGREDAASAPAAGGAEAEQPLWKRYDKLPVPEKVKLAKFGGEDARRLVMKDRNQAVHAYVLDNAGLTVSELVTLLRNHALHGSVIQRVLARPDWMANPGVLEAIVVHPQTPIPVAVQTAAKLPLDIVRRLARQHNLRQPVTHALRKRVA